MIGNRNTHKVPLSQGKGSVSGASPITMYDWRMAIFSGSNMTLSHHEADTAMVTNRMFEP